VSLLRTSGAVKEYYDTRAPEYDEWYEGSGLFARRERPGWHEALSDLMETLGSLEPVRTLDVACGTGFLTAHLPGPVTGLDQSARMLAVARRRLPDAMFVQGDALTLPFPDHSFERVFTGHFYGHLEPAERERFLGEARRLARELVVVDSALRPDHEREEWQERTLNDGARFQVFKRYFDGAGLTRELGGGEILHSSPWFVAVASTGSA
jgi:demethylmenaquinone methyltransferase/2-methoxy-6-polyprenyl-1,4-benzoquinol methylase